MKKSTLMIIGAGMGQIPAIQKGKQLGLTVIAVDRDMNAPGMKLADVALEIDVVDRIGILRAAREFHIDGIMTMQSDLPVPTIGYVNDRMVLTGVSLDIANKCSNKVETRECFKAAGIPQPDFRVATDLESAKAGVEQVGLPCVIKAPDSSGSRGVVKITTLAEVDQAFAEAKSYSRSGQILIEEYISGLEIGAQAFSVRGECECVLVHNDTLSPPPYMIPVGHSFPFKGSTQTINAIEKICAECISALGIIDGPSNIDLIYDEDRGARIIEVGARIGATCLPELVETYSGIDWVKASIKSCLGQVPDLTISKAQPVAALILESPFTGVLGRIELPENIDALEELVEWEITTQIGARVAKLSKGTDRIGKVLTIGTDVDAAEMSANNIKKDIVFKEMSA